MSETAQDPILKTSPTQQGLGQQLEDMHERSPISQAPQVGSEHSQVTFAPKKEKSGSKLVNTLRALLAGALISGGVAGAAKIASPEQTSAATKDGITREYSPRKEQQVITSYIPEDIRTVGGNRLVGIITLSDGVSKRVIAGTPETLTHVGEINFRPYGIASPDQDPNTIVVVGSQTESGVGYDDARISITKDGGATWTSIPHDKGRISDVQFDPTGLFAYMLSSNKYANNEGRLVILDIANNTTRDIVYTHTYGTRIVNKMTPITGTENAYKTYVQTSTAGYWELTIGSQSASIVNLNAQQGTFNIPISQTVINQETKVYTGNNITKAEGGQFVATVYQNSPSETISFTLRPDLYPEATSQKLSLRVSSLLADTNSKRFFSGVSIVGTNNARLATIEARSLEKIQDNTQAQRVKTDGDWITSNFSNDEIHVNNLGILKVNDRIFLTASLAKYDHVQQGEGINRIFSNGYVVIRDITDGLDKDTWHRLPSVTTGQNVVTPTPTVISIPTSTPQPNHRVFISFAPRDK